MPRRLLRIPEVRAHLGNISRSSVYRLAKGDPRFPRLLKVGGASVVDADALDAFIEAVANPEVEA